MSRHRGFGVDDLLAAYLEKRRWSEAHPDLQGYHARRYAALAAAFAVDLDEPPGEAVDAGVGEPSWFAALAEEKGGIFRSSTWPQLSDGKESSLASLFESTVRQLERLGSPFDGYLEAPPIVIAFYTRYAGQIKASIGQARSEMTVLLREVACTLWSLDPAATVSADALRAHGFEPDRGRPDPIDYW